MDALICFLDGGGSSFNFFFLKLAENWSIIGVISHLTMLCEDSVNISNFGGNKYSTNIVLECSKPLSLLLIPDKQNSVLSSSKVTMQRQVKRTLFLLQKLVVGSLQVLSICADWSCNCSCVECFKPDGL